MRNLFTITMALLASAIAVPTTLVPRDNSTVVVTTAQVLAIAPTSGCCKNAPFPVECATARKAVAAINKSYVTYKITSVAEAAALISLQAFETGDFKYSINHFPGRVGQGTRNMQMIGYNFEYAKSIPTIQDDLTAIIGSASSVASLSDVQQNQTRDLLNSQDEVSFGSAAWYLTTQCTDAQRTSLQKGDQAGWTTYIEDCVGTDATDERVAGWKLALAAFKLS